MNKDDEVFFGVAVAVCTLIVMIGAIFNCLVIYFASKTPMTGTLRHLNTVVRQLAISDFLYCILGWPFLAVYFKMGKM